MLHHQSSSRKRNSGSGTLGGDPDPRWFRNKFARTTSAVSKNFELLKVAYQSSLGKNSGYEAFQDASYSEVLGMITDRALLPSPILSRMAKRSFSQDSCVEFMIFDVEQVHGDQDCDVSTVTHEFRAGTLSNVPILGVSSTLVSQQHSTHAASRQVGVGLEMPIQTFNTQRSL
jgi:hypothetical protein